MSHIKMIVGLGNPIQKYNKTRHNIGSWYIQLLCKYNNITLKKTKKFFGYVGQYQVKNFNIWLLIPNTFMNCSGSSIFAMSSFYNIRLDEILIVHDELDLSPGKIKLKYGCGHNGHNGLRNIITQFGKYTHPFCRVRIGIGRPNTVDKITSFVLSPPVLSEKKLIITVINNVINDMNILISQKKFFMQSTCYNVN